MIVFDGFIEDLPEIWFDIINSSGFAINSSGMKFGFDYKARLNKKGWVVVLRDGKQWLRMFEFYDFNNVSGDRIFRVKISASSKKFADTVSTLFSVVN